MYLLDTNVVNELSVSHFQPMGVAVLNPWQS
jgi:hypothetical protein